MKTGHIYFLTLTIAFALTACGGGSDDDNNAQVEPTAQITNTQQSVNAVSAPASERMTSGFLGGSSFSTTAVPAPFQIANDIPKSLFKSGEPASGMQIVQINLCTAGSITLPPADATSGTITFNNCEIAGSGLYFNGSINFSASQSSSGINVTITYNGFTISDSAQTLASLSGTLNMTLSYEGNIWSTAVSTSGFSVTADGETIRMDNYSHSNVFDFNANESTVSFHYAVTSSVLGGTLIVTTDPAEGGAPLVYNPSDAYPYTGTIIIIGADNDRVRITINGGLATDTVVVEYALDGDGVYDDGTESLSWSELEAQSHYALNSILN